MIPRRPQRTAARKPRAAWARSESDRGGEAAPQAHLLDRRNADL